jgi:poly-beta-1,6-N-acetyl-D-glucosamine synthase
MGFSDILIYIASFIGLFTSLFYILTLLSPSRSKSLRKDHKFKPKVSIIVPIWNEGSANGERLKKTINSLLNCNYPKEKLEIIIVNDGSTDNSLELAKGYEKYGIKVLSNKISGGKTNAINKGMKYATGELVAGLDADSFIEPDVIDKMVPYFKKKKVMAVIPSVKIYKPKTFLQKIQFQEFLSAVFVRHLQAELGAIPLAPGAFTMIRKTFIDKYGGLNPHTMVEDLEMSMRIQSENYLIENVIDVNVYTSGVKTVKAFFLQRIRWFLGFIIQIKKYKHLFGRKYGNLGVFILPVSVAFILLTIIVFCYSAVMLVTNTIKWIHEISIAGYVFEWFPMHKDLFFFTISNKTILPIILLIIMFLFMRYIKKISNEKQSIIIPFISFIFTYWLLGALCWLISIYYYITKKPVRWGPNKFIS